MLHLGSFHRRQSVHLTIEVVVLGDIEILYINEVFHTSAMLIVSLIDWASLLQQ